MRRTFKRPSHSTVVAYVALFIALATGSAWAAATIGPNDIKDNAIHTRHIKNNAVKKPKIAKGAVTTPKLGDNAVKNAKLGPAAVTGDRVATDTLTGDNIDESTLGQVPDSDRLDGLHATSFLANNVYKAESAVGPGTALGDGTFFIDETCDSGDRLLSGGPANIKATTTLLESFPAPGGTNTWRARINKNGVADDFSVVILCVNQP